MKKICEKMIRERQIGQGWGRGGETNEGRDRGNEKGRGII